MQNVRPAAFDGNGAPAPGASLCPGCGQPVDPLRAGHVAILEGRGFSYFCDAECKHEYLRSHGQPSQEDVPTAAPPEVRYVTEVMEQAAPTMPPSSGVRAPLSSPPRSEPPRPSLPPARSTVSSAPSVRPTLPSIAVAEAIVESGRRPLATPLEARRAPAAPAVVAPPRRSTAFLDGLGIVAGAFTAAI